MTSRETTLPTPAVTPMRADAEALSMLTNWFDADLFSLMSGAGDGQLAAVSLNCICYLTLWAMAVIAALAMHVWLGTSRPLSGASRPTNISSCPEQDGTRPTRGGSRPTPPTTSEKGVRPSDRNCRQQGKNRRPAGRVMPELGARDAETGPTDTVSVTRSTGPAEIVLPVVVNIDGREVANPANFLIEQTVVAPGERLVVKVAYQTFRRHCTKAGLKPCTTDLFGRAATTLGWSRGKAGKRYFRDRALKPEPTAATTEQSSVIDRSISNS